MGVGIRTLDSQPKPRPKAELALARFHRGAFKGAPGSSSISPIVNKPPVPITCRYARNLNSFKSGGMISLASVSS